MLENRDLDVYFLDKQEKVHADSKMKSCEAILVRGATIDRELIKVMPNLKVIDRSGVGTDNIDIDVATDEGVHVCNVPDANFISVSEHVLGLMLSLSHQIVSGDGAIREGNFDARHQYIGTELSGKCVGIIGFGRIGKMVAQKCIQGFDMNAIAYDPYVTNTDIAGVQVVETLDHIYKEADYITLHLPYTPSLNHFIGETEFEKMKSTSYVINCARGGLIDEVSLAKAVKQGVIAGAGIDVFEKEPPNIKHELWDVNGIIATPHMGASTEESLRKMATGAAMEIIRVLNKEEPRHSLNKNFIYNIS